MAEFQDDTAAQIAPSTDALAIVGAGAPVGQVLPDFGAEADDSPDDPIVDRLVDAGQRTAEAKVVADHEDDPLPCAFRDQIVDAIQRVG